LSHDEGQQEMTMIVTGPEPDRVLQLARTGTPPSLDAEIEEGNRYGVIQGNHHA
jgi:hypothetical protein